MKSAMKSHDSVAFFLLNNEQNYPDFLANKKWPSANIHFSESIMSSQTTEYRKRNFRQSDTTPFA